MTRIPWNRFLLIVAAAVVLSHVAQARLFDRQLSSLDRDGDPLRRPSSGVDRDPRDPHGAAGPFARLMAIKEFQTEHQRRFHSNRKEEFSGNESSSLLMGTFHLLDVSNLSEQLSNVARAFFTLAKEVVDTVWTMVWGSTSKQVQKVRRKCASQGRQSAGASFVEHNLT
jgi:uncharacterized protein YhhL (DUF1145 family)